MSIPFYSEFPYIYIVVPSGIRSTVAEGGLLSVHNSTAKPPRLDSLALFTLLTISPLVSPWSNCFQVLMLEKIFIILQVFHHIPRHQTKTITITRPVPLYTPKTHCHHLSYGSIKQHKYDIVLLNF